VLLLLFLSNPGVMTIKMHSEDRRVGGLRLRSGAHVLVLWRELPMTESERAHVEHLVGAGVGLKVHTDESTKMLGLQLHEVMETAEGLQVLWDVTLGQEHHQRAATSDGNDAPSTSQ
jgi:hypothetical protein